MIIGEELTQRVGTVGKIFSSIGWAVLVFIPLELSYQLECTTSGILMGANLEPSITTSDPTAPTAQVVMT